MLPSMHSISISIICLLLGMASAVAGSSLTRIGNNTIERTVQLRTHSLYAPYIDQDLQNRWWDFGADSYVNTNKHIRLTRNVPSQMGWLWSRLPLTATNYVIEAEFKVSGHSTHLFGDGLAMWFTTERTTPGPVFGNKDKFKGLGIMLDTYANSRHSYSFPRVIGVLGDGETSYDLKNDGDSQAIGGCSADFRRTNVATKLKVTYLKDTFLDVKLQYKAWDAWTDCFHVTNISLPTSPYLGFSALTGDVSDAHDIITVTSFSALLSAPDAQRDKIQTPGTGSIWRKGDSLGSGYSSWFGRLFKFLLFGVLCTAGFFGYKEYLRRQGRGSGNFNFGMNDAGYGSGLGAASGSGFRGGYSREGYGNMYSNKRF